MKMLQAVAGHFRPSGDAPADGDAVFSFRNFALIVLAWMIAWTVWPALCVGNVHIDVAENIAWGAHFQLGYDKNPYFGAWLSSAVFRICPCESVFYFLSQLSVGAGLIAAYLLTLDVTKSRFRAFVAGVSALLIPFFSHSACEFNDDVISISLWGWTALCFYRSVKRDSLKYWLGLGVFSGLALMTKYLAGALLLPLGILLLATPEGRRCWKSRGLYLAAAVFLLLTLPNLVWLCKHDFIAISYAFDRAKLDKPLGWLDRVSCAVGTLKFFVIRLIPSLLALLIFRRGAKNERDGFGVWTILSAAVAPLTLSLLFTLTTGGDVLNPWLTPYFVFATPLLVLWYCPQPGRRALKGFSIFVVFVAALTFTAFGYEYLYKRPYIKGRGYNVWPGRAVAERLTREWRSRYGTPLPYVIGGRKESCNMAFYSADRPSAFFDHDVALSPWIDVADVRRRGAVIVWSKYTPPYLKNYAGKLVRLPDFEAELAYAKWFGRFKGSPGKETIHAAFLPPEAAK